MWEGEDEVQSTGQGPTPKQRYTPVKKYTYKKCAYKKYTYKKYTYL